MDAGRTVGDAALMMRLSRSRAVEVPLGTRDLVLLLFA
jgi:hypothetical protein